TTNQVIHVTDNKNILLPGHKYQTGDAVTYQVQGGTSIIPIASTNADGVYYVIVVNDHEIRLARTPADATNDIRIALQLTNPNDPTDRAAVHTLEKSIGGLRGGVTYYVKKANPGDETFQLAAVRNGAALALDPSNRPGTHFLGVEGIDLVAGSGTHKVVFRLP